MTERIDKEFGANLERAQVESMRFPYKIDRHYTSAKALVGGREIEIVKNSSLAFLVSQKPDFFPYVIKKSGEGYTVAISVDEHTVSADQVFNTLAKDISYLLDEVEQVRAVQSTWSATNIDTEKVKSSVE